MQTSPDFASRRNRFLAASITDDGTAAPAKRLPRPRSAESSCSFMGGAWMQQPNQGVKRVAPGSDLTHIWKLTHETGLPLDDMRASCKIFREFAAFPDGERSSLLEGVMDQSQFRMAVRKMTDNGSDEQASDDAVESLTESLSFCHAGVVGVREFSWWYHKRSFDAALNLDGVGARMRDLAKKHGMPHTEVERCFRLFNESDDDVSGYIDFLEFQDVLYRCAKIPSRIGLPPTRVQELWRIADSDCSGDVNFEEFLLFYRKYFDAGSSARDPFEGFYRDIWKVAGR